MGGITCCSDGLLVGSVSYRNGSWVGYFVSKKNESRGNYGVVAANWWRRDGKSKERKRGCSWFSALCEELG